MENKGLLLYDGHCAFCSRCAELLRNNVSIDQLSIVSAHSNVGMKYVKSHNLEHLVPSTLIYINEDKILTKTEAVFESIKYSKWSFLRIFKIIPVNWRNGIYDWISKNRYLLGRVSCEC